MKKKKTRLNKLKAKAYIKHLTTNGFNQTKAYKAVSSSNTYDSAKANASRFNKGVITNDNILNDFKLDKVTIDFIVEEIVRVFKSSRKSNDKLKALELLGKFRKIFTDTQQSNQVNIISSEVVDRIERLRTIPNKQVDIHKSNDNKDLH